MKNQFQKLNKTFVLSMNIKFQTEYGNIKCSKVNCWQIFMIHFVHKKQPSTRFEIFGFNFSSCIFFFLINE